jgi:radical SAM superfamily enzyme YgiQ (UPF0313 family)
LDIVHKRQLIDYPAYLSRGGSAAIATKTGCPFSCNYCLEQRRPLQRRSRRSITEELNILSAWGISFLFVAEPEFNNHLQHALDFCNLLLEENFFFEWTTYLYPVPMTEDLVRKLKASGCVNPCVSVGAGNDGVLRALDNRFTVAHVRRMAEWFHKYSLPFTVDLLFGGPGDTLTTARQTIDLMEEIQPAVVGMNLGLRLYRNTGLGRKFMAGELDTAGKVYGSLENNDDLFEPVFYISDMRIRDYLMDVCDASSGYQLLGYSGFAGVNYKTAMQEA